MNVHWRAPEPTAAPQEAKIDLPRLPTQYSFNKRSLFSMFQMHDYARDAVLADRAKRAPQG